MVFGSISFVFIIIIAVIIFCCSRCRVGWRDEEKPSFNCLSNDLIISGEQFSPATMSPPVLHIIITSVKVIPREKNK